MVPGVLTVLVPGVLTVLVLSAPAGAGPLRQAPLAPLALHLQHPRHPQHLQHDARQNSTLTPATGVRPHWYTGLGAFRLRDQLYT